MKYPDGSISKLEPMVAFDDMEACISRLRDLLDAAESYSKFAYYESAAALHFELAQAMEKAWQGFESILDDLPE